MIDEANVGAAHWRWRTGRLNRRDDEIDDRSSSGAVDEVRRAVAADDVVREEAPAGKWSGGGCRSMGFCRFWRPLCTNGQAKEAGGGTMAKGRACLKCGVSYESTPTCLDHGTSRRDFRLRDRRGISCVGAARPISEEGEFSRMLKFRDNKARVEGAGVSQHKRQTDSLKFRDNKARLEISGEQV